MLIALLYCGLIKFFFFFEDLPNPVNLCYQQCRRHAGNLALLTVDTKILVAESPERVMWLSGNVWTGNVCLLISLVVYVN